MISGRKYKKYPEHLEVERPVLDPNSSLTVMLELIGERKKVLDLGCASGYLAKLLTQRECDVVGIDMNPTAVEAARAYCTRAMVADLDSTPLMTLVDEGAFDVVVCGDVLEHLRFPTRLLEDARAALREGGSLIASIPNVAHGAVRLKLLDGSFDYQELGILDDTHLRFFTAKTVDELFVCAGYRVDRIERTTLPIFSGSDLVPPIVPEDYPADLVEKIRRDPECETLQFVVKASPLSDDLASRAIAKRFLSVNTDLANAKIRIEHLEDALHEANQRPSEPYSRGPAEDAALDEARRAVVAMRSERDATARLNAGLIVELRAALEAQADRPSLERAREELERSRAQSQELGELFVRHLQTNIDRARDEVTELATQIERIKSGRLWRLRNYLRRLFRRGPV